MAGGGGHPLAGKDALHRRPDHLVHEASRSSAVSLYPHQPLPFIPRSTIHRSSRESHHEEEVSLSSRDRFCNQSNQSGMQPRVQPPGSFIPKQPQALLCSAHCLEYLIPGTQERETVCHLWSQHQYGQEQVLSG